MARNVVVALLVLAAGVSLLLRPLVALVLIGAAGAVFLDGRHLFGSGRHRAFVAFISSLWLGLAGVGTAILGMVPTRDACEGGTCEANFLLLPGLLLLAAGLTLLGWSVVSLLRMRRAGS